MRNVVVVELAYEQFLKALFGCKNYHGCVGEMSFAKWRDNLVRVVTNLRRAIVLTLHTDAQHLQMLEAECDQAIDRIKHAKSEQDASSAAIRYLARIAFMLVGEFPDNYDEAQPTRDKFWILNRERQIGYTQSMWQKAQYLRRLDRQGHLGADLKGRQFERKYHELEGNPRAFVQWVKDEHPDVYLKYL